MSVCGAIYQSVVLGDLTRGAGVLMATRRHPLMNIPPPSPKPPYAGSSLQSTDLMQ